METQLKFYNDPPPAPTLAAEEVPETKFLMKGTGVMTNIDLLAVILNNNKGPEKNIELSRNILANYNNDLNDVARTSIHDLIKLGATKKQAITVSIMFELARRKSIDIARKKTKISNSKDIWDMMNYLAELDHEEFFVILLNRSNRIIKTVKMFSGGVSGTVVDVKLILKCALDNLACSIMLCHNHPSGNIEPSENDKKITYKVRDGAKMMDMQVLDHIIIGGTMNYYSFADEGII